MKLYYNIYVLFVYIQMQISHPHSLIIKKTIVCGISYILLLIWPTEFVRIRNLIVVVQFKRFWGTLFTNVLFWRSYHFFTYKCKYLIYAIWKLNNIFCRHFRAYYCWFGRRIFFENEIWGLWYNLNFFEGQFSQMFYFGEVINFLLINASISSTQSEK